MKAKLCKQIRKMLPKNTRGAMTGMQTALLIAVVLGAIWLWNNPGVFSAGGATTPGVTPTPTGTTLSLTCANDPSSDLNAIVSDKLTASTTYLAVDTMYVKNDRTGVITTLSTVGNGASGSTETDALECGTAQKIYTQSNETIVGGTFAELSAAETERDPVVVNNKVPRFDNISIRFFDRNLDGFMFVDQESITTPVVTATDFVQLVAGEDTYNTTGRTFYGTTANTSTTVNAGNTFSLRFDARTNQSDMQFGTNTIVCIDYKDESNSDDWQDVPAVNFDGSSRADMMNSLSSNDQAALSGYESCYDLGIVDETERQGTLLFTPGSGVNPDYNPRLRFLAGIVYIDDDDNTKMIGVGPTDGTHPFSYFRTDAGRTVINGPFVAILEVA